MVFVVGWEHLAAAAEDSPPDCAYVIDGRWEPDGSEGEDGVSNPCCRYALILCQLLLRMLMVFMPLSLRKSVQ